MMQLGASRRLIGGVFGASVLAAGTFCMNSFALGQDQSAATPKDVIFARKVLMNSIGDNMDEIDTVVTTGDIDLAHVAGHADSISVSLMVFPHLFPPASNEWKAGSARDPATDTFASPDVWGRFTEFYAMAAAASKIAYNTSRARNADEFKKLGMELRQACDACHAIFLKTE